MAIPLPFVVAPKNETKLVELGNEEAGVISIVRKGFLSVGEKAAFQQVETNKTGQALMLSLVHKIEKETKKPRDEVVNDLSKIGQGTDLPGYLQPFLDDIVGVLQAFESDMSHTAMIKALVLLISRVSPEYTVDDILVLHPDLITALAELYDAEEKRSLAALPSEYTERTLEENESKNAKQSLAASVVNEGKKKAHS